MFIMSVFHSDYAALRTMKSLFCTPTSNVFEQTARNEMDGNEGLLFNRLETETYPTGHLMKDTALCRRVKLCIHDYGIKRKGTGFVPKDRSSADQSSSVEPYSDLVPFPIESAISYTLMPCSVMAGLSV